MIFDCPSCGAILMFDPETGMLKCESCNNLYESGQLNEKTGCHTKREQDNSIDTIECNIYSCTACGAEIIVNDVESSTFCSYCGRPTLIFSRIDNAKKPQYILPFTVTKERAASLIKDNFAKGELVPEEIRNLNVEQIRGIYIPYWLFDIHYEDEQLLQGSITDGKNTRTYKYFRRAESNYSQIAIEASLRLNDTVSRKLNPYHTAYLKPFSTDYLSGFYSDMFDVSIDKLEGQAILRAQNTFDNEIRRSVVASNVKTLKKNPKFEITDLNYALFPAWFFTFRSEGKPYTLLVNGQTEKVVGNAPFDKKKAIRAFFLLGFLLSILLWCMIYPFFLIIKTTYFVTGLYGFILAFLPLKHGLKTLNTLRASNRLTTLTSTDQYVKDRQGGN